MAGERVRLKVWDHNGTKHNGITLPLSAPAPSKWTGEIVETRQGRPTVYVVRRDFDGKLQEATAAEIVHIPKK